MDSRLMEVMERYGGYGEGLEVTEVCRVYRDLDRGAVMQSKELY